MSDAGLCGNCCSCSARQPGGPAQRRVGIGPGYLSNDAYDCHRLPGRIVLTYGYGVGERVAPFLDARGPDLVAGVEHEMSDGPHESMMLLGEARFTDDGTGARIFRPDGSELPCPLEAGH